ncbi:MAG: MFS transporter [Micromonosporaceae bacterium]|nr:MFS transporter [Micromonosporaceae bacterium]
MPRRATAPTVAAAGRPARATAAAPAGRGGWAGLAVVATAQMMTAVDATVVNIALPSMQPTLGFGDADRQWVITAYTLAFAGLLLVGGRAADRFGRRRTFLVGLAGFASASALAGVAPDLPTLVAGRALQGAFAAVLAPSALSLITVLFDRPRQRATAFAVYGAVASSGAAVGLLLGGALTDYLNWRWCLFINVPIALGVLLVGRVVLPTPQGRGEVTIQLMPAVLATAGLAALVLGCAQAAEHGWTATRVVVPITASVAALTSFVALQARLPRPLLPLRLLRQRDRVGAYFALAVGVIGSFGMFLMLTYHFQTVAGYSPLRSGLAFLPMTASVTAIGYGVARRLASRVPPGALIAAGLLGSATGLALLTQLEVTSGYFTLILPAEILVGAGGAAIFTPAIGVVTTGVDRAEAGIAAAAANVAMQLGASLGVALLNSVAVDATRDYLSSHVPGPALSVEATVHGSGTATAWAAGLLSCAAVVTLITVRSARPHRGTSG